LASNKPYKSIIKGFVDKFEINHFTVEEQILAIELKPYISAVEISKSTE
jgi:hypothetical protein